MNKSSEAVLLRIFIGESDEHQGKKLYRHIIERLKKEGIAGATVLRGIEGFGKTSHIHTNSILRLSTDMPIVIEVTDTKENFARVRPFLDSVIKEGLMTEEKVRIIFYEGNKKDTTT